MPNYEYIDPDSGRRVIRRLPVAERDSFPGRVTVPSRVTVPRPEPTQGDEVLRGFARCEEKDGTESVRQIARGLGTTRDAIKKAWSPEND